MAGEGVKKMETTKDPRDKIEVVGITPLAAGGNLKAFVSIRLGAMTIHGLRIIQQAGKPAWVALPQREAEQDGKKRYFPIVEIDSRALRAAIEEKALAAWHNSETGERS
jgi:DNA-binding cell septation regulator SpoVG